MRQLTATGFWPLYRFDPRRADEGKLSLALDSRPPSDALAETLLNEQRFRRLNSQQPEVRSSCGRMRRRICKNAMTSWPDGRQSGETGNRELTRSVFKPQHKKKPEYSFGLVIFIVKIISCVNM